MKTRYNYDTLSEALNNLIKRGYTVDFQSFYIKNSGFVDRIEAAELHPEEFTIDEIYRFEGMTDPGDSMILCAISSSVHKTKGFLLNAYGLYADTEISKIVKQLFQRR